MRGQHEDQDRYSRQRFDRYITEHFGDDADTFLLSRVQQRRLLGKIVRLLRETRRCDEASEIWSQPALFETGSDSNQTEDAPRTESQGADPATPEKARVMSQNELAAAMHRAWWHLTHEQRYFDGRWVRRLEDGGVIVDRPLILCLAYSLEADDKEIAILLEAAGYNGWNAYKALRLNAPRATIIGWLEEGADAHRSKKLAPMDILTLLKFRMEAEILDASPPEDPEN